MKKICILMEKPSFWKIHGQISYSNNVYELAVLVQDGDFEMVFGNHNDFNGKWKEIKNDKPKKR